MLAVGGWPVRRRRWRSLRLHKEYTCTGQHSVSLRVGLGECYK